MARVDCYTAVHSAMAVIIDNAAPGGGGSGGLNCDPPGGMTCAEAAPANSTAAASPK